MVLVVPVVLCKGGIGKDGTISHIFQMTRPNPWTPLTCLAIVDGVEEQHRGANQLEHGRNTSTLRLDVLVLPPPPGTADTAHHSLRRLVATSEPGAQLGDLHLAQGHIS